MGVVTTIEINSPLNLIRSVVVGNVFSLKNHIETTIKIKPQLKKIVVGDVFHSKNHFKTTIEIQPPFNLLFL